MIDKREITPKLLADLTALLFTEVPIQAVLEDRIEYDKLSAEDITRIVMYDNEEDVSRMLMRENDFARSQSWESCMAMAHSVIDYVSSKAAWQNNHQKTADLKYLNVFDLLMLTLQDLLVMNQNRLECRYEEIGSWRTIARYMGEELALSARYAQCDHEYHKDMRNRYDEFAWPYVTAHNNKQLNSVVQRGVSEHHCHLWGATPYFHISWIRLMNEVSNREHWVKLQKLCEKPWGAENESPNKRKDDMNAARKHRWEAAHARAAWIRLYLCKRLCGSAELEKDHYNVTDAEKKHYDIQNVCCYDNWRKLLLSRDKFQSEIDAYSYVAFSNEDYALAIANLNMPTYANDYHVLIGERWLYYQIFHDYCKPKQYRRLNDKDYNLFFAYFLIRLRIRSLMVQNNDYIGFDNFQRIERRKADFLGTESERSLVRLTINDTLKKSYIRELEVRISPQREQIAQLGQLESYVNSGGAESRVDQFLKKRIARTQYADRKEEKLIDRYYYVFHFLKREDTRGKQKAVYDRASKTKRICRHRQERLSYLEDAKRIIEFRKKKPKLAKRVLGIDAASKEIGCRPEVLSTAYRLLGSHQYVYGGYLDEMERMPALGKTFHVGEDFSDIVNGLRAIDEVINFLDFDCGDRLGHAIVLGVDVEEWYARRQRAVYVSVQERIDDLAWLYHALTHFSVPNMDSLKERLNRDFEYWFRVVYRNSIKDEHIKNLMESARRNWYDHTDEDHGRYQEHTCHFDILDYYRAWTLRGDDPECYIDGFFKKPLGIARMISEENAKVSANYPLRYDDRYIPEYSLLNYLYQFDDRVYREGARKIKVDITEEYIRAVKAIQVEMRYRIAKKGIAIETNPTSNVLIGTFRKYEKHPILAFYNRGLPVNDEEEQECAQIQVSINTDDRGVFYTDLETEYALLAHSVEQIVDENDKPRFKKTDIYAWLDNIREMGNDQSFRYFEKQVR